VADSSQQPDAQKCRIAPIEEIRGLAEACKAGGNFDPHNTADGVLADKLDDYGDGRAAIVRRDLSYRGGDNPSFQKSYDAHRKKLIGTTKADSADTRFELPDGSTLTYYLLTNRRSKRQAVELNWAVPTESGRHYYCGLFTVEEAHQILEALGLTLPDL
jgi:hypothetical protein